MYGGCRTSRTEYNKLFFLQSGILAAADPSSEFQEESQVLNVCPPANKKKYVQTRLMMLVVRQRRRGFIPVVCSSRCVPEDADMESGADSTTHCIQSEGEELCSPVTLVPYDAFTGVMTLTCLRVFQREPLSSVCSSSLRVRICAARRKTVGRKKTPCLSRTARDAASQVQRLLYL